MPHLNHLRALASERSRDFVLATLVMALTSLIAVAVGQLLAPHNVLLVFFLGVLAVAVKTSVFPALWSAVLGFLAYNFFFTEPHHTFEIMHRDDLLTAIFFLLLSGVTGKLAAQLRHHILALEVSGQQIQDLLNLSHQLASAPDSAHIEGIAVRFMHSRFATCVLLLRRAGERELVVAASAGSARVISPGALVIARQLWDAADTSQLTATADGFIFLRLASAQKTLALIAIATEDPRSRTTISGSSRAMRRKPSAPLDASSIAGSRRSVGVEGAEELEPGSRAGTLRPLQ